MKTLVIAEPGCTAQGDVDTMVRLIDTAADCGADVYKATWVSSADRLCERRHADAYRYAYLWHQWPVAWHQDLRARCHARGLQYACTVDLPEDVTTLAPLVDYLKIAAFEALDRDLIAAAYRAMPWEESPFSAVRASQVIISAGMMATVPDYRWWDDSGACYVGDVLHCVSSYPAPLEAMNLRAIRGNGYLSGDDAEFSGLSDHSRHLLTGALAVACGARIVETHFRLASCDSQNPDYAVAFTPAEFAQYVRNIRDCERMLGDGRKTLQDCERPMLAYRV